MESSKRQSLIDGLAAMLYEDREPRIFNSFRELGKAYFDSADSYRGTAERFLIGLQLIPDRQDLSVAKHTHIGDNNPFVHTHRRGNIPHVHHGSKYARCNNAVR